MPAGWIHYGSVHISRASPRATLTIYHNVKWLNAMTRGQKKVILLTLLLIININNILKQVGGCTLAINNIFPQCFGVALLKKYLFLFFFLILF
jgi:hypothetical protein